MKNTHRTAKNSRSFAVAILSALALVCCVWGPSQAQAPQVEQPTQASQQRRVRRNTPEDISAQGKLARIQDYLKYPPESRPIDSTYWDLLHPWNVDTQTHPLYSQETIRQAVSQVAALQERRSRITEDDNPWTQIQLPPSPYSYRFEMNKTTLAGTQDKLQARLTVTPANSSDSDLSIQISKAEIIGSDEFGSPNLGEVPYSCETTGPVCTFTWQAASGDKQFWGSLTLVVTLAVAGTPDEFVAHQSFFSSPMTVGKFTGQFQEKLADGSLVVTVGVDIQKRAACFVSANLYSADTETPLQHVHRRMLVDPSMKTIALTFFGKIFRDYGDEGTFRVQDLQAQCANVPYPPEWFMDSATHREELREFYKKRTSLREPTHVYFAYNNYSYTTQKYANSAFSDAEWQSPEKTGRLEMERRAAALRGATADGRR